MAAASVMTASRGVHDVHSRTCGELVHMIGRMYAKQIGMYATLIKFVKKNG
jgi:hypothetical protein